MSSISVLSSCSAVFDTVTLCVYCATGNKLQQNESHISIEWSVEQCLTPFDMCWDLPNHNQFRPVHWYTVAVSQTCQIPNHCCFYN